uniref:Uncharacterized protein n=1 Tax=Oryza sativa subsp. japonica TaxID=39947 RepID=Q6Z174_ORYSJ|nr:hypothetical protein [Oryza sativa Japonica Group]
MEEAYVPPRLYDNSDLDLVGDREMQAYHMLKDRTLTLHEHSKCIPTLGATLVPLVQGSLTGTSIVKRTIRSLNEALNRYIGYA